MKGKSRKLAKKTPNAVKSASAHVAQIIPNSMDKLLESGILQNFVTANRGSWDHQLWLDLCAEISRQNFGTIDFDQVGMVLERMKSSFAIGSISAA